PPFTSYRVTAIADNTKTQPPGYYLGIGLNAYGSAGSVAEGDSVTISENGTPSFENVAAAVGGGPLLVRDGAPYADPDGPSGGEFNTRIPSSGVAITADGTLLLVVVDGRQPVLSVGLSRAQFASLLIALGSVQAMALDGGGSSTLVARRLGDDAASVRNSPSDGTERRVADGLFIYSNAPHGPASRLAVRPQTVRAFVGARVQVDTAAADAAGHPADASGALTIAPVPADLGRIDGQTFIAGAKARDGMLRVRRGALETDVPVHVVDTASRIEITPKNPDVNAGETLRFSARAFDRTGYPLALPPNLQWTSSSGRISDSGAFVAASQDAVVGVRIAQANANERVSVGQHVQALQLGGRLHFTTIPRLGPGSLNFGEPCPACISLQYDFTGDERAAYASGDIPLPDNALGLTFDARGDGNGEVLRVAVLNAINERVAITAAKITWTGWRRVTVAFPPAIAQPLRLEQIYAINAVGGPPVNAAGSVALRDVRVVLAGSAQPPRQ
ncbi:MAG: phosphodiester glycosidase family protein, partial [Candidatus Eremiobacteraeota bacterium]|nr:phosphodiester glycosidase family protein [Candidatus Eremiobacteraeota bacterium]